MHETKMSKDKIYDIKDSLQGRVLTVLGTVSPNELGVTLPHEHLLLNFTVAQMPPTYTGCPLSTDAEMVMQNLGKIRHYPYSVEANIIVDSEDELIEELKLYKEAGGDAVCDIATSGIRIKPECLSRMSQESGIKIVAGTGYYVDAYLSEEVKMMSEDEMVDSIVKEIMEGIGDTGVKCGVIGEVGCSWPLTSVEHRSLRAAARAQRQTGAPLIIHPGRDEKAPFEILDVLEEAGADISHAVMAHLDRTIFDEEVLLKFAERGCYLEYDLFGLECSHYQYSQTIDMPSDAQRIQKVKLLVDKGYAHRVLLSQDIHTKHRLVCYGGHGYGHILECIVPKMKDRGIPEDVVKSIITDNPRKLLTFV